MASMNDMAPRAATSKKNGAQCATLTPTSTCGLQRQGGCGGTGGQRAAWTPEGTVPGAFLALVPVIDRLGRAGNKVLNSLTNPAILAPIGRVANE